MIPKGQQFDGKQDLYKEPDPNTNEEFIVEMGGPEALIEHRKGKNGSR